MFNYRASTQNSQRSLPEIPHLVGRHDSGDTASEIYATVNLDQGLSTIQTWVLNFRNSNNILTYVDRNDLPILPHKFKTQ